MITPADIQAQEFSKGVRGYSQEEVDEFLDSLTLDYESVLNENAELKKEIASLTKKLEGYKTQENTVLDTLETAKKLMNDISASAEKRADILLKNAQLDSELKVRQAEESVQRLKEEEANLTRRVASVRSRFKTILESELERFDDLTEEIFGSDGFTDTGITATQALKFSGRQPAANDDLSKTKVNIKGAK